jgi:hypothetical protein
VDGEWIEDENMVADGFNNFFASVGPKTNKKVEKSVNDPDYYLLEHSQPNTKVFQSPEVDGNHVIEKSKNLYSRTLIPWPLSLPIYGTVALLQEHFQKGEKLQKWSQCIKVRTWMKVNLQIIGQTPCYPL